MPIVAEENLSRRHGAGSYPPSEAGRRVSCDMQPILEHVIDTGPTPLAAPRVHQPVLERPPGTSPKDQGETPTQRDSFKREQQTCP